MSEYLKHIELAKVKLVELMEAYKNERSSVVGDLGTKIVEQLVEADLARKEQHSVSHYKRHSYMNKSYPREVNLASKRVWAAYGDLGYDGLNGKRAKIVLYNLKKILVFFEELLNEKFITEEYPKED